MDKDWKDSLRERFSDYSVPEPEGLWEGIEQGIAGKARRSMLPVWLASGAAIAAAVALVVFLHPEKTLETPDLQKRGPLAESVQAAPFVTDAADASSPVLTTPSSPAPTAPSSPAPGCKTAAAQLKRPPDARLNQRQPRGRRRFRCRYLPDSFSWTCSFC